MEAEGTIYFGKIIPRIYIRPINRTLTLNS